MKDELPSLITDDVQAGLTLADELADHLHTQFEQAGARVERPGGMNYLAPPQIPKDMIASILFYVIAAANGGWTSER